MRLPACLLLLAMCASCRRAVPPSTLVLWAWERPEDLRFASGQAEVAVLNGSVVLDGGSVRAQGRRFPLLVDAVPATSVVHVEIDRHRPLAWTPGLRAAATAAVLHYATRAPARRVQIDFEVRASERHVLLDVLADLRRALPRGTMLSMTALASWCGEDWLDGAPVDEVVPMLFRMGRGGAPIRAALARGGDLRRARCPDAPGVAIDTRVPRAPGGRRVYLFDAHSWTPADLASARREVEEWR